MESDLTFSHSEVAAYYQSRIPALKQRGASWRCPCPLHRGTDDNFAVDALNGKWFCHSQCQRGGDLIELEILLTGLPFPQSREEVLRLVGRMSDKPPASVDAKWLQVAVYPYVDEKGSLLFEIVRQEQNGLAPSFDTTS